MSDTLTLLEKDVVRSTGLTIDEIRNTSIDERRDMLEKVGQKTRFFSAFPLIGRGNINRITLSTEEINKELDEALSR
jgi:hypothetical protein